MNKFVDETGNKYGKLTVLEYAGIVDKSGRSKFKCQCECGNIIYARGTDLRQGKYTSCGCNKGKGKTGEDLTGQRFGMLEVIEYNKKKQKWLCHCDCGRDCYISITRLLKEGKTDCGCSHKYKYRLINKDERFEKLYSIYMGMKKRCYNQKDKHYRFYGGRGIKICDEWLGKNGFSNFFDWSIKNNYMILSDDKMENLSIDRIDSDKDYCPENCRWIPLEDNVARAGTNPKILERKVEELNTQSEDELVQNYIQRKMELQEQLMKEKDKVVKTGFFFRKPNYCYLHNEDNTKQFLFRNYKTIGLFLEITYSSIYYRMKNKDGFIAEGWKLEKVNKEDFINFKDKGIEVIR